MFLPYTEFRKNALEYGQLPNQHSQIYKGNYFKQQSDRDCVFEYGSSDEISSYGLWAIESRPKS